jgi:hypothetical protein
VELYIFDIQIINIIFTEEKQKIIIMFRTSKKEAQLDMFSNISGMLKGSTHKLYNNEQGWHNIFRGEVYSRINENIFKLLFSENMGAPNASIRVLISMMILKEAFGWSDSQLFEQCRFNLLIRSAIGLFNLNDDIPVESTYYLLRKRIYNYQKQTGEDLIEKVFEHITRGQIKEFNVNGRNIRMDSKLIGSNIALFSRYEIIHHTLCQYYKKLDKGKKLMLIAADNKQLTEYLKEDPEKTIYRSTKQEIKSRMQTIGLIMYKVIKIFVGDDSEHYQLVNRVFNEQYKFTEDKQIVLRAKEEITSDSVQSPHDPDSAYRNKDDQQVKGYSTNITETASDNSLNLITNAIVEKANTPDTKFVKQAIKSTTELTEQPVEKVYSDGAYQSPDNDDLCKNIDMVYTGIQGFASRYDLEMTPTGLVVTDTQTGEVMQAIKAKKLKNSKEERWRIKTENGNIYFGQKAIRSSYLRNQLKNRSIEELNKRNNVEATIFQLSLHLRNNKSKYRGLYKQKMWVLCRCSWINLVRIMNYVREIELKSCLVLEELTQNILFFIKSAYKWLFKLFFLSENAFILNFIKY